MFQVKCHIIIFFFILKHNYIKLNPNSWLEERKKFVFSQANVTENKLFSRFKIKIIVWNSLIGNLFELKSFAYKIKYISQVI